MAKKNSHYISIKESRAILKYNIKQMKYYEAQKLKKRDVSAPFADLVFLASEVSDLSGRGFFLYTFPTSVTVLTAQTNK